MAFSISVQPVVIGIAVIVAINFFISLGKSNVMKKSYIIISTILSLVGIIGIIFTRIHLISSLNKNIGNVQLPIDSGEFITWAINKFDFFAAISISATCIVIIFLCYLLFTNKKDSIVLSNISSFVNIFRIIIFLFAVWYSMETINKFFDLGSYILALAIFGIFVLYIPLVAKRIMTNEK
ncbi:hypothetical protein SYNTR_0192 [Candidatus Syntrophocurvum alkaliphilum]|uniref:Uncharacterized protein n=1 Tax=Candidatus Syntrophocurvum alkaliphilum TaxID=2293317 RepID=A0A6I6DBI9_9FIRM|nr:hypothetical protein [Candidatus Syntrophocurvum alkaliphilum]QGT98785.1 hypothetical protein SYNTR_0192 [Candidatus Syntrophocurvum alkaliphilum]